jgi:hypothetical protein
LTSAAPAFGKDAAAAATALAAPTMVAMAGLACEVLGLAAFGDAPIMVTMADFGWAALEFFGGGGAALAAEALAAEALAAPVVECWYQQASPKLQVPCVNRLQGVDFMRARFSGVGGPFGFGLVPVVAAAAAAGGGVCLGFAGAACLGGGG